MEQDRDRDGAEPELRALASRLGEWPLLLRLVNSTLRNRIENDNQSLPDALAWVNKALDKRGLTYFDARNREERQQAVTQTIGVSLDLLSEPDRARYGELAVFPEDVEIPLATLEKLWGKTGGFDEFDTEDLCTRLNRFSLLWSYDATKRRIWLHDVIRSFLIEQQRDKLPSIHHQLLDAHLPSLLLSIPLSLRLSPSVWSEMPKEEPYLWGHLAFHLIEAGRGDELLATVKDLRYLAAKMFVSDKMGVYKDLVAAKVRYPNDVVLNSLFDNYLKLFLFSFNGYGIQKTSR